MMMRKTIHKQFFSFCAPFLVFLPHKSTVHLQQHTTNRVSFIREHFCTIYRGSYVCQNWSCVNICWFRIIVVRITGSRLLSPSSCSPSRKSISCRRKHVFNWYWFTQLGFSLDDGVQKGSYAQCFIGVFVLTKEFCLDFMHWRPMHKIPPLDWTLPSLTASFDAIKHVKLLFSVRFLLGGITVAYFAEFYTKSCFEDGGSIWVCMLTDFCLYCQFLQLRRQQNSFRWCSGAYSAGSSPGGQKNIQKDI